MSSKIEWTDETWNPTLGCDKVSAGCDNCYAVRQSRMRSGNPNPKIAEAFRGLTIITADGPEWSGKVKLLPERLQQPLRWKRPRRVFVDSLTDLFHAQVPRDYIARVFAVMSAGHHTYQLLTKRHGRMRSLLSDPSFPDDVARARHCAEWTIPGDLEWPLPNLHLGVSVEDQRAADLRIPALLSTPAAVRWISAEPLLGPVDLTPYLTAGDCPGCGRDVTTEICGTDQADAHYALGVEDAHLHWVVVGGESGPGARPMAPQWARDLRDQCAATGVAYSFKQWGEWGPTGAEGLGSPHPERSIIVGPPRGPHGVGEELVRMGKKAAGRELDGVVHDELPAVVA